jgi:hypothetical protein
VRGICVQASAKSEYLLFPFLQQEVRSGRLSAIGRTDECNSYEARLEKKANDTKPKTRTGAAQLRQAADLVLQQDCHGIAEALSKSSKDGKIQSTKFLYELAERNEEAGEGDGARKLRSMAEELANAARWTGDWPKAKQNEDDETATDA